MLRPQLLLLGASLLLWCLTSGLGAIRHNPLSSIRVELAFIQNGLMGMCAAAFAVRALREADRPRWMVLRPLFLATLCVLAQQILERTPAALEHGRSNRYVVLLHGFQAAVTSLSLLGALNFPRNRRLLTRARRGLLNVGLVVVTIVQLVYVLPNPTAIAAAEAFSLLAIITCIPAITQLSFPPRPDVAQGLFKRAFAFFEARFEGTLMRGEHTAPRLPAKGLWALTAVATAIGLISLRMMLATLVTHLPSEYANPQNYETTIDRHHEPGLLPMNPGQDSATDRVLELLEGHGQDFSEGALSELEDLANAMLAIPPDRGILLQQQWEEDLTRLDDEFLAMRSGLASMTPVPSQLRGREILPAATAMNCLLNRVARQAGRVSTLHLSKTGGILDPTAQRSPACVARDVAAVAGVSEGTAAECVAWLLSSSHAADLIGDWTLRGGDSTGVRLERRPQACLRSVQVMWDTPQEADG